MARKRTSLSNGADPNYMLSLERGLSVLEAFGTGSDAVLSIAKVARATRMSAAAARRCLHTLQVLGYVSQTSEGFQLSTKVLSLAYRYFGQASLPRAAQAVLDRVTNRIHESTAAAVLEADAAVVVASATARQTVSINTPAGSRLPAYCTSLGLVLLASADSKSLSDYIARTRLVQVTPHTSVNRRALIHSLAEVRRAGYALVDQQFEAGVRGLAVPVRRPDGTVIAAINIATHTARHEPQAMVKLFLPLLREAAQEIAATVDTLRANPLT